MRITRAKLGGGVAAVGMLLLALGQTGGAVFPGNPQFGTYLGLSPGTSRQLSLIGFGLIAGVAIVGALLDELEDVE
jgi:hypothetical protein